MFETNLQKLIMLGVSKLGTTTIFRNNVGMGWIGKSKRISQPTNVKLMPGDVLIQNGRPLHAGLCEGSSDLVGWTERTVTPDMVGKKVAIFTAVEVKTDAGRVSTHQLNFISRVRQAGGIAGIARNPEEARNLIEGYE
jgi:hypothetical protein